MYKIFQGLSSVHSVGVVGEFYYYTVTQSSHFSYQRSIASIRHRRLFDPLEANPTTNTMSKQEEQYSRYVRSRRHYQEPRPHMLLFFAAYVYRFPRDTDALPCSSSRPHAETERKLEC